LTGMMVLVLWGLFIQGCNEMIRLAMRNRYDDPLEAIIAIFEIGAEYGLILLEPVVIGTLIAGAILAGLATEVAWRKWR